MLQRERRQKLSRNPSRVINTITRNEILQACDAVAVAALREIARADGFRGLGLSRREAAWAIKALRDETLPLFAAADDRAGTLRPEASEPEVALSPMTLGREVVEDYRSKGLSLRAQAP